MAERNRCTASRVLGAMRALIALLLLIVSVPAASQDTAPLPRPRPTPAEPATAEGWAAWLPQSEADWAAPTRPLQPAPGAADLNGQAPLPRSRPERGATIPAGVESSGEAAANPTSPDQEAEPQPELTPPKPPRIYQTACPAMLLGQVEGKALPPLVEKQCGTQSPLSITAVLANGRMVPFSGPATLTCGMATALPHWVAAVDNYVQARDNTRIASVIVGTSYMCRNVNNSANGNLSDHAFADALDVVGFRLDDGRTITVTEGWPGTEAQGSRIIRYAHDAACSSFTTVLGPEANAQHHDHLHLDLLCHGKTCTARMCE